LNPLDEAIVAAYAEHGVDNVQSDAAFSQLALEHKGDTGFNAAVFQVSQIASGLERNLEGQTHRHQAVLALKHFNTWGKRDGCREICRLLTRRRYAPRWSRQQQSYYETASEKLATWCDYFLSFTNYNPTAGEIMFVNNQHHHLIRVGLGRSASLTERRERNLVALVLEYTLKNSGLKGFYYPDAREPENVKERLQREASSTLAFVQLIQNTMFDREPNYCLEEFDAARGDPSRKLIFVMAQLREDFRAEEDLGQEMHGWHKAIESYAGLALEPMATEAQARSLLREIKESVVAPIRAARKELFEGVPA
jgi:hypothetical protein